MGDAQHQCGVDSLDTELVKDCPKGCVDGVCLATESCDAGFADCTDAPACETETNNNSQHCGECDNVCAGQPNTTGACADGVCACSPGYGDCTAEPGCETAVDASVEHCGTCGNVCGSNECIGGVCSARVFVTSGTFQGNIGDLATADAACQKAADDANLDGTFMAWLSNLTVVAATRLTHHTGRYLRLDGVAIAENWADLTDKTLAAPLNVTETGVALSAPGLVWSATDWRGSFGGPTCSNWTDLNTIGSVGQTDSTTTSWTDDDSGRKCDLSLHLYCFEEVP